MTCMYALAPPQHDKAIGQPEALFFFGSDSCKTAK